MTELDCCWADQGDPQAPRPPPHPSPGHGPGGSLCLFERKNGGWIRHSVERARRKVYESTSTLSRPDSRPLKGQLCGQGWSLSFIDDGQQVDRIFITWVGISGEQGLEPFLPNSSGFLAFFVLFMSGLIRLLVALF